MQPDNSFIKKPLKKKPKTRSRDWRFLIYVAILIFLVILFNFFPPARDFLVELGEHIEQLSWFGPLLFIFFLGCFVIPFGLPYLIFECTLALLYTTFWTPYFIALVSKFLGCSLSYYIAKLSVREKIEAWLEREKIYVGVQKLLNENPWKFSLIFRIILMPYVIKNYGLALPSNINYGLYITCALLGGALVSAMNINFAQQTKGVSDGFFNDTEIGWLNVVLMFVTLFFLVYVAWYTMKILRDLRSEENIGKSMGMSLELEAPGTDDSTVLDQDSMDGKRHGKF